MKIKKEGEQHRNGSGKERKCQTDLGSQIGKSSLICTHMAIHELRSGERNYLRETITVLGGYFVVVVVLKERFFFFSCFCFLYRKKFLKDFDA